MAYAANFSYENPRNAGKHIYYVYKEFAKHNKRSARTSEPKWHELFTHSENSSGGRVISAAGFSSANASLIREKCLFNLALPQDARGHRCNCTLKV